MNTSFWLPRKLGGFLRSNMGVQTNLCKWSDLNTSVFLCLWQTYGRRFGERQWKDIQKSAYLRLFTEQLMWSRWKEYGKAELWVHVSFIKSSSLFLMRPYALTREFTDPQCWAIIGHLLKHAFFSIYKPDWEFYTLVTYISTIYQHSDVKRYIQIFSNFKLCLLCIVSTRK